MPRFPWYNAVGMKAKKSNLQKINPKNKLPSGLSQAVLDALPFQMAILDKHGKILRVNQAWIDFARENSGDAKTTVGTGVDYLKVCRADRSPKGRKVVKGIESVLAGETTKFESEYPCHSPKQKRWFIMQVSAIMPLGHGAVIAHFKITDRVLAEIALKKSNAELLVSKNAAIQSEKAKAEFLAQMSHEIRTPLNGMIGFIEGIRDWKLESSQLKVVDHLDSLADHLLGVLNDVLDYSKIEAGKFSLQEKNYNPRLVAETVREMLDPLASSKNLKLYWLCHPDFPDQVYGDERRLRQILFNLMGNAIKFTEKGKVSLIGRAMDLKDGSTQLEFAVQDTGIGISAHEAKSLFQSFSQVQGRPAAGVTGTGLGLLISKHLAIAMGGDILLESIPGKGSTFTLTLQAKKVFAQELPGKSIPHISMAGSEMQNGRILIADDNEVNRKIMISILEKAGWKVLAAKDGLEALAMLADTNVDAIFLDCQMPHLDGYGTATEIRKKEANTGQKRIPIVAITADVMEKNLSLCREAGMDDFLPKPFRRADIAALLGRLFGKNLPFPN